MVDNPKNFVASIDVKLSSKMIADLQEQGFTLSQPSYTLFSAKKKGIVCTLYESGKLVVQGKELSDFIEFYLEPEILKEFKFTYQNAEVIDLDLTPHIGVDESGKGDFFGPLCVAAVYAGGEGIGYLKEIGVCDSKLLNEKKTEMISKKIKEKFPHYIVKINPAKYNEVYAKFRNLNTLLAWAHATAIENLSDHTGCKEVLIDQFASEGVVLKALERKGIELKLTQKHRGEEDLVVAAASILARQTFLEGLKKLGLEFQMTFPKGASAQTIQAGKEFVLKYGEEALSKVGKMHFKTVQSIL